MNMLDDVEFQIARLDLREGDQLVVRSVRPLTGVVAGELRARLERQLNLPGRVLVMGPDFELSMIACDRIDEDKTDKAARPAKTTAKPEV